jgi:hypothetical protein
MVINGSTGIFDELSLGDHFYFSTTIQMFKGSLTRDFQLQDFQESVPTCS